jgi:hypothetical protein
MSTVKAIAHLNELTKDVTNDYYLLPLPDTLGILHEDDIIRRPESREIATRNVNGKAFLQLFHRECVQAVSEGYSVVTGLFYAAIGFTPGEWRVKVATQSTSNTLCMAGLTSLRS